MSTRPGDLAAALAPLLSMGSAGAVHQLAAEAEAGEPEALEWAAARLGDLEAAAAVLRAIIGTAMAGGEALTVAGAAAELGMDTATLRRWIQSGRARAFRAPNAGMGPASALYLTRAEVDRLLALT